jgi:hypothetical protein
LKIGGGFYFMLENTNERSWKYNLSGSGHLAPDQDESFFFRVEMGGLYAEYKLLEQSSSGIYAAKPRIGKTNGNKNLGNLQKARARKMFPDLFSYMSIELQKASWSDAGIDSEGTHLYQRSAPAPNSLCEHKQARDTRESMPDLVSRHSAMLNIYRTLLPLIADLPDPERSKELFDIVIGARNWGCNRYISQVTSKCRYCGDEYAVSIQEGVGSEDIIKAIDQAQNWFCANCCKIRPKDGSDVLYNCETSCACGTERNY